MPYRDKNKNKQYFKEYEQRPEVKQRRKEYRKKYFKIPKVIIHRREYMKNYSRRDYAMIKIKKYHKEYYQSKEYKQHRKEYNQIPRVKEKNRKYTQRLDVKIRRREMNKTYIKNKKKTNLNYKILDSLRTRLWQALNRYSRTGKVRPSDKYGIDYKEIIEHLKPFPEDISKYHIDHIIPLAAFNFDNPEEIKLAFAPENHQWMLGHENLSKHDIIIVEGNNINGRIIRQLPLTQKIEIFNSFMHERLK